MDALHLYRDDFLGDPDVGGNPRDVEDSSAVVRNWFNDHVRYAVEDIPDERCLRLIAERLVVRRMLGLGHLDADYEGRVSRVEVFGPGTPIFSELAMPSVFVAMAFVPLKPTNDKGHPRLARLYCVGGLATQHTLPLEGMDEQALHGLSWFIDGVPKNELERGIGGRSWLLAAHLLAKVVRKADVQTARNLTRHYIVTGDVKHGNIKIVDLERKIDLAKDNQFKNFKWIIPKENTMDIPRRKIEKPATLNEAYSLIESMQSVATASMFGFLRYADVDGVKREYNNGADIYAREQMGGLTPIQLVEKEINKAIKDLKDSKSQDNESHKGLKPIDGSRIGSRIDRLKIIKTWLQRQGADCALMFYMLAKLGDRKTLEKCLSVYPINAVDSNGLTAVDWALNAKEWDVASILHSCGGTCNPCYGQNKVLGSAIAEYCECMPPPYEEDIYDIKARELLIAKAIENGLSPNVEVSLENYDEPNRSRSCTLFGAAILFGDYNIVEVCLKAGANVNAKLEYYTSGGIRDFLSKCALPIDIVRERKTLMPNGEVDAESAKEKDRLIALLLTYGAKDTKVGIK